MTYLTLFNNGQSFGSWVDMLLMNQINSGGWVTINFLPTAAHTIQGLICGQILLSKTDWSVKAKTFLKAALALSVVGYLMDFAGITPIVKRIATTSFTLVSGGWAILTLLLFYWLIDVRGVHFRVWKVFSVVGTNSIFIYLFVETLGVQWFRDFGKIFSYGLLEPLALDHHLIAMVNSIFALFMFWGITYFLDKKKVYFKI